MTNYVDCVKVTEEELAGPRLAAEGEASWEIMKTESAVSGTGNPKAIVTFAVVDSTGKPATMLIHVPMHVSWRVARLASATGTSEEAKAGRLDIDKWVHKKGRGMIKHDTNDKGKKIAAWKYFIKTEKQMDLGFGKVDPEFNDKVPF